MHFLPRLHSILVRFLALELGGDLGEVVHLYLEAFNMYLEAFNMYRSD
jgi:hypothetical protein